MKPNTPKKPHSKRIRYILFPFFLPLCLIALGILLLVNESLVTNVFIVFGVVCALVGMIEIVIYASRRQYEVQTYHLINGIVWLIGGALLIIIPLAVNTLIPLLIGICVLASGISGIANTFSFRHEGSSIMIPILFATTNCVLGIIILIYVLFVNRSAGWNVIGILMIISGTLRILNEIFARISVSLKISDSADAASAPSILNADDISTDAEANSQ